MASVQNAKVIRLEAEVIRLRMTRTDKDLTTQVEGLRHEVGRKDREAVDLRRALDTALENGVLTLRRATSAEQKIATLQNTLMTFQKARDAAYAEVEKHDRERLDAVRQMVDAVDRAKKAEARIEELEKKGKPVAKVDPKAKK